MIEIEIEKILCYKIKQRNGYCLGGFYLIRNKINNKCYIGKSMDYMARLKQHTFPSSKKTKIDKSLKEFGYNNFEYFLLENYVNLEINHFTRKLETIYEHRFITKFKTNYPHGYNERCYGHL